MNDQVHEDGAPKTSEADWPSTLAGVALEIAANLDKANPEEAEMVRALAKRLFDAAQLPATVEAHPAAAPPPSVQPSAPVTQKTPVAAGSHPTAIVPTDMDSAWRLATAVHKAGMTPYGIDTPEKAMIAIMTGLEVGLPPMMAMQGIAIIGNRPTIWGDAALALVRSSGLLEEFEEYVEGEGDERVGVCTAKRVGVAKSITTRFSVAEAKQAGLWQTEAVVQKRAKGGGTYEAKNDSPWFKYQSRMLKMRSRGFTLRDLFTDVLKGLYLREEFYGSPEEEKPEVTRVSDPFAGEGPRQITVGSSPMATTGAGSPELVPVSSSKESA